MLEKRLEDKVEKWLESKAIMILAGSVRYRQLNNDALLPSGIRKPMHIVVYQSWVVENESTNLNCIYVDPTTEKLTLIVTPHVSTWIEE
jgi:hypothetical protein